MGLLLLVLLILLLVGAVPRWNYSAGWGNGPAGVVFMLILLLLILMLIGGVPHDRFVW